MTEMMIVVAIIGVLAALAVPTYLSYLPHLRLNAAVRDITTYIRSARAQAAIKGRPVQLNFILTQYPATDTVKILDYNKGNSLIGVPESLLMNVDIDGILFASNGDYPQNGDSSTGFGASHEILFTPFGSVVDANGSPNAFSIFLCSIGSSGLGCVNSLEKYRIDVSSTTGFPTVVSPGW